MQVSYEDFFGLPCVKVNNHNFLTVDERKNSFCLNGACEKASRIVENLVVGAVDVNIQCDDCGLYHRRRKVCVIEEINFEKMYVDKKDGGKIKRKCMNKQCREVVRFKALETTLLCPNNATILDVILSLKEKSYENKKKLVEGNCYGYDIERHTSACVAKRKREIRISVKRQLSSYDISYKTFFHGIVFDYLTPNEIINLFSFGPVSTRLRSRKKKKCRCEDV